MNNTYGIKTVSEAAYDKMVAATPQCLKYIHNCNEKNVGCALAETYCNSALVTPYSNTGLNVYDIRVPCGDDP